MLTKRFHIVAMRLNYKKCLMLCKPGSNKDNEKKTHNISDIDDRTVTSTSAIIPTTLSGIAADTNMFSFIIIKENVSLSRCP